MSRWRIHNVKDEEISRCDSYTRVAKTTSFDTQQDLGILMCTESSVCTINIVLFQNYRLQGVLASPSC